MSKVNHVHTYRKYVCANCKGEGVTLQRSHVDGLLYCLRCLELRGEYKRGVGTLRRGTK